MFFSHIQTDPVRLPRVIICFCRRVPRLHSSWSELGRDGDLINTLMEPCKGKYVSYRNRHFVFPIDDETDIVSY